MKTMYTDEKEEIFLKRKLTRRDNVTNEGWMDEQAKGNIKHHTKSHLST